MSRTATAKPPADGARGALPDTLFDAILVVAFGGRRGRTTSCLSSRT
jgi:hypothetical protein